MHNSSDIDAILLLGVTSIHNFPIRTTGQDFLHSCLHLLGLHLSALTIAIRVSLSVSSIPFRRDIFLKTQQYVNFLKLNLEVTFKFTVILTLNTSDLLVYN